MRAQKQKATVDTTTSAIMIVSSKGIARLLFIETEIVSVYCVG